MYRPRLWFTKSFVSSLRFHVSRPLKTINMDNELVDDNNRQAQAQAQAQAQPQSVPKAPPTTPAKVWAFFPIGSKVSQLLTVHFPISSAVCQHQTAMKKKAMALPTACLLMFTATSCPR
jgi:hypothetical protein